MRWQTIDTVSKDREVLLVDNSDPAWPVYAVAAWQQGEWRDAGDLGAAGQKPFEPTHWAALEPPDWRDG